MRIIELLRKLGDMLVSKQDPLFLYDVEKQRKYITTGNENILRKKVSKGPLNFI